MGLLPHSIQHASLPLRYSVYPDNWKSLCIRLRTDRVQVPCFPTSILSFIIYSFYPRTTLHTIMVSYILTSATVNPIHHRPALAHFHTQRTLNSSLTVPASLCDSLSAGVFQWSVYESGFTMAESEHIPS